MHKEDGENGTLGDWRRRYEKNKSANVSGGERSSIYTDFRYIFLMHYIWNFDTKLAKTNCGRT